MHQRTIDGLRFKGPVPVEPMRGANGAPLELMPQSRYPKRDIKRLNRHGQGPFCRFKVAGLPPARGVYVVEVSGTPTYVGRTTDLAFRWGTQQFGAISPASVRRTVALGRRFLPQPKPAHHRLGLRHRGRVACLFLAFPVAMPYAMCYFS